MHLINENDQTDPKNYQNYKWIHLCSLLPIQKVLKTNPNWIIALNPNLIESFSTLRFFFLDTSVCKHCIWHIMQNLLIFFTIASTYDIMRSWQISWFLDFVCFFRILKPFGHMVVVVFPEQVFKNSFHFLDKASHRTQ